MTHRDEAYALLAEIASGGMASVHLAVRRGAGGVCRTVAVKRLHPHLAKIPNFASMLVDEARLTTRIHHPNVVSIIDVIEKADALSLVMEYVDGVSLAFLFREAHAKGAPLPLPIVSAIACDVLRGLQAAHTATDEHGQPLAIVHRDVSPQNVIVGSDGVSRVCDFGVAMAKRRLQETHTGELKGKLAYMAPEQLVGGSVSARTDVYAVGVILWELLTRRRLYAGDPSSVELQVKVGLVEPPSYHDPSLPDGVDALVARALATDPEERFASANALLEALQRCAPAATSSVVSDWIHEVAGDELARRAAWVEDLEGKEAGKRVTAEAGSTPSRPVVGPALVPVPRRRGVMVWGATSILSLLAVLLLTSVLVQSRTRAQAASAERTSVTAPSTPAPPLEPLGAAPPQLSRQSQVDRAGDPSVSQPTIRGSSKPPRRFQHALPRSRACEVPFTLDADRRRVYKLECL